MNKFIEIGEDLFVRHIYRCPGQHKFFIHAEEEFHGSSIITPWIASYMYSSIIKMIHSETFSKAIFF